MPVATQAASVDIYIFRFILKVIQLFRVCRKGSGGRAAASLYTLVKRSIIPGVPRQYRIVWNIFLVRLIRNIAVHSA